jgi:ketosteroid isomerase-like protein
VSEEPRTTGLEDALRRALGAASGLDMARVVRDDTAWAAYSAVLSQFVAPDFVFEASWFEEGSLPDMAGQAYRGLEGLRRSLTTFTEPFEAVIYDFERLVGSGDRLVSIYRMRARARHSGISLDFQLAYILSVRDDRIVHVQAGFRDPSEALKAVGL